MNGLNFIVNEVKKEKELVKNSLLMFIATSVPAVLTFLANLILARIFGPLNFGLFKNTLYLFTSIALLVDFGAGVTVTKYIAEFSAKSKSKIGHMNMWFLKLRLYSYIALLLLIFLFYRQISIYFYHDISFSYLVPLGATIVIANFFGIFVNMTLGFENFKLYMFSAISRGFLSLFLGVFFGYYFGLSYALIAFTFSFLFGNIICLPFILKKKGFEIGEKYDMKPTFFKFSLPMHIFSIPSIIGGAVIPALSLFFSAELIGNYSFSFLFYYAGMLIPSTLAAVLLPKISRMEALNKKEDSKKTLLKVYFAYTFIAFIGIIFAWFFSDKIIAVIGPQYLPYIFFLKVLVTLGMILGYLVIYNSYLTAKGKVKEVALITLIQNLLLFLVSFLLLKSV